LVIQSGFRNESRRRRSTRQAAEALTGVSREHGLAFYLAYGAIYSAWARARLGDEEAGITVLRQALTALTEQGIKGGVPFLQALLAEIEAKPGSTEGALTRIDAAMALANETGEHQSDGFLHRVRGDTLLKRDRSNSAAAKDSFLTAIAYRATAKGAQY
jgi:predicted ATPase